MDNENSVSDSLKENALVDIKSVKDELNNHINNDNFGEYINNVLKILGIPTNSTNEEEVGEENNKEEDNLNATKDVSFDIKKK
jgi:hypothetical protein